MNRIYLDWLEDVTKETNNEGLVSVLAKAIDIGMYTDKDAESYERIYSFADGISEYISEYIICGCNVFNVGIKLATILCDTSCNGIPEHLLKAPHKAFYLQIPDICEKRSGILVIIEKNEILCKIVLWDEKDETHNQEHVNCRIPIPESKDGVLNFEDSAVKIGDHFETMEDAPYIRLVINCLVYMNSLDVDAKTEKNAEREALDKDSEMLARIINPKMRQEREKQNQRRRAKINNTVLTYTWLGKNIEDSHNSSETAQEGSAHGNWATRRGHWHSFWTGSRTAPDGQPRLGEKLVVKWMKPIYRGLGTVIKTRAFGFMANKVNF